MLILPIVNRNRVLNVEIKLKDAEKIRSSVKFDDALESDVIVNGKRLSESQYKDSKDDNVALNFVRSNSLIYRRNYLVTTREEANSSLYDVYEVSQPPKKVNDSLDRLYTSVITDMRKEIPGVKRGRYLSFEKLGIDKHLTDEKIAQLQRIVKEHRNSEEWPKLFEMAGVADLPETLSFIQNFDCTVISDTTIPEDSLQSIIKSWEGLNTRDSRNLCNYYEMALSNRDIYGKLSYINKIIYGSPLTLIQSASQKEKQKQLVKKAEEVVSVKKAV